jgi:hypothetical protein
MKDQIKELRVKIDGLSQLVKELNFKGFIDQINNNKPSHELDKCYDSLILAKAWLGKVLGELGEATPYANDGKRTDVNSIEPTADTSDDSRDAYSSVIDWNSANHIEKVDWLRQEIQSIINFNSNVELNFDSISRSYFVWAFKYLCEARFWLGFELGRIKESGATRNNI